MGNRFIVRSATRLAKEIKRKERYIAERTALQKFLKRRGYRFRSYYTFTESTERLKICGFFKDHLLEQLKKDVKYYNQHLLIKDADYGRDGGVTNGINIYWLYYKKRLY